MRAFCFSWLLVSLTALFSQAAEEVFDAKVLSVTDGDTVTVRRISDQRIHRIRFYAIDAPEIRQQSGIESRDALKLLIGESNVTVKTTGAETYGRLVGRVYVGNNYLNALQVSGGWAWHYKNYTEGQPEHTEFKATQEFAKEDGAGLWAYHDPIPPWKYRQMVQDGEIEPHLAPLAAGPLDSRQFVLVPREALPGADLASWRDHSVPLAERADASSAMRQWEVRAERRRDSARPATHFVFGKPKPIDSRHRFTPQGQSQEVAGITELTRTAFSIGHYDKYRVPGWVSMKWTYTDFVESEAVSLNRPRWREDSDLPAYARGNGQYNYSSTGFQKGHMARDADMEAWGRTGVTEATLLSNAIPQKELANHAVWGVLEDEHRHIVANDEDAYAIETVWVISGPVFYPGRSVQFIGNTGIPHATYKVIAWKGASDNLRTRGYIIGQDDTSTNISGYLRSINEIENVTGFDFFAELDDPIEDDLEDDQHTTLWE